MSKTIFHGSPSNNNVMRLFTQNYKWQPQGLPVFRTLGTMNVCTINRIDCLLKLLLNIALIYFYLVYDCVRNFIHDFKMSLLFNFDWWYILCYPFYVVCVKLIVITVYLGFLISIKQYFGSSNRLYEHSYIRFYFCNLFCQPIELNVAHQPAKPAAKKQHGSLSSCCTEFEINIICCSYQERHLLMSSINN